MIFFLSLIFLFFFLQGNATNVYKKIQPYNMAMVPWQEEDWPEDKRFVDYLNRCFTYHSQLQPFKKRKLTFTIFDNVAHHAPGLVGYPEHTVLADITTAQDITLISNKQDCPYVAQILDRTKTELGKVAWYGLLAHPIYERDILEQRQTIIRYLMTHNSLLQELDDIYSNIQSCENILLSFWGQDNFQQAAQRCYFDIPFFKEINDKLNNSHLALQINSLIGHQERFSGALFLLCGALLLPLHAACRLQNIALPQPLTQFTEHCQGRSGSFVNFFMSSSSNPWVSVWGAALATACMGFCFGPQFNWARDCVSLELFLQKKLIMVAQFFKEVEKIIALTHRYAQLAHLCPYVHDVQEYVMHIKTNKDIAQLLELLSHPTFAGEASPFSLQGKTLLAYKLIHKVKVHFEPLLFLLGHLDAYCGAARLFKEFETQRVKFCFAQFCTQDKPYVCFSNMWNPLINENVVVPTNIELGGESSRRNMIITGPNAGGKSAFLKGFMINMVLAHSLGMVAAESAWLTPFYMLATYLNIADDIASGNSLFKAQVLRAQELLHTIPSAVDHFVCLIFDELFNGTSAQESLAAAYSVAQHIAGHAQALCLMATHFPFLTRLAQTTDSFANYRVCVSIDAAGHIRYPFTLEKGISEQHVALDILKQEGLDSTIVQRASEILRSL